MIGSTNAQPKVEHYTNGVGINLTNNEFSLDTNYLSQSGIVEGLNILHEEIISAIEDRLPIIINDNLLTFKSDDGTTITYSANYKETTYTLTNNGQYQVSVLKTYKTFPTTWVTSGTTTQFMQSIENDADATTGMVYLGELTCSDLPFVGNGDAVVEIVDGTATEKVIVLSLNSGDVAPYYWRYTYCVISGIAYSSGWISFVPTTRTINGKALSSDITLTALDVNAESIATYETYTIASNSWTSLASSDPFKYQTTVTATYTIGNDTEVGIINDQAVLFANYGFLVGSVSGQSVTIYSIAQPDSSVTLKVGYRG